MFLEISVNNCPNLLNCPNCLNHFAEVATGLVTAVMIVKC